MQDAILCTTRRYGSRQRGLTLIELMIAMVVGMFLVIGTLTVFSQSRSNFRVSDNVARMQENARFALDTMEPDIRLTKFWGRSAEPGLITTIPAAINVTCDTTDTSGTMVPATTYTAWSLDLRQEIWAVDESSGYSHPALGIPCTPRNGAQAQSDALVVRHASGQVRPPAAGMIQVITDLARADLFNGGVIPAGYSALAQTHDVVTNVYYVDRQSDISQNVPSLRIKTLGAGGIHQDQELIAGVENLQIQFGVDTDGDNEVERYVDADHAIINPTNGGTIADARVIAVRLWLLMRADVRENGFTDIAQYTTPDPDVVINPCTPSSGCEYPRDIRRMAFSKTVFLRNSR